MRRRANQIIIRLNDEEHSLLKRKVQDSGMSMSRFFRVLILSGEVKVLSPEFVRDIQRQVRGVGRNVNQLTRLAHISGKVSMETLRQISAQQEKLEQMLERLE
ncbi:plasmid mobilization relaxosome protein MobC [Agathobaculum sp. Marseille-P7918]|uniref:plasmid mobilization protein n=1 Tax=Agathobaculum sp. Marseille-P7918 TaxID=2479843 RepID=UPI0035697ECC